MFNYLDIEPSDSDTTEAAAYSLLFFFSGWFLLRPLAGVVLAGVDVKLQVYLFTLIHTILNGATVAPCSYLAVRGLV